MVSKKHIRSLPIKNLLCFLLVTSIIFQCVLSSYRHLMGVYLIKDAVTFWATLILSSIIGTFAGLILAVPDLHLIKYLDKWVRLGEKSIARICIQLVLTVIIAAVVSTFMTLLSELIIGYKEPLIEVLIRNAMIFSVVNIILMAILEGWMFFEESKLNKERAETLSYELLEIRYEVLKNQIDPHFIFNNLNVLSALVNGNSIKAQEFIEELSDLYRYVLDTIDKPVVTVAQELGFIKSYFYMQQIRYNESIILTNNIPSEISEAYIPPFSIQIVIENALKHNIMDIDKPLRIELEYVKGNIEIRNNIQLLISSKPSTGLGQINLIKRYELISDTLPVFEKSGDVYVAKLPLIIDEEI